MNTQPLLATAALVVRDQEIFLLKRGREPYKYQWGFPGGIGGFKKTADPLEAIVEEVKGDVGCEFRGEFFTYNYSDKEGPTVTLFYVGSIHGELQPVCKNVLEAKYFLLEDARRMELAFDHSVVLERYLM